MRRPSLAGLRLFGKNRKIIAARHKTPIMVKASTVSKCRGLLLQHPVDLTISLAHGVRAVCSGTQVFRHLAEQMLHQCRAISVVTAEMPMLPPLLRIRFVIADIWLLGPGGMSVNAITLIGTKISAIDEA